MEVILLEKVANLGTLGDRVRVRPGYGRNFLLPQGKAVPATPANIKSFEVKRAELEKVAKDKLAAAEARRAALAEVEIEFEVNVSPEGRLYGSIGAREIADRLSEKGLPVARHEVLLGQGPLRQTGEFNVALQLHADVETTIKVKVRGVE